jgi:hypothetical protein
MVVMRSGGIFPPFPVAHVLGSSLFNICWRTSAAMILADRAQNRELTE